MSDVIIRLGLIGDNIAASQAPRLHRLAGRQSRATVTYERFVPRERGMSAEEILAEAVRTGLRGVNITQPYKERIARLVTLREPLIEALGAVNTVLFEADGPVGHNTDRTGFMAAYREARGVRPVGPVLVIGAGGVGRAIAFALLELGASEIRLADDDTTKAEKLAQDLRNHRADVNVTSARDAAALANGLSGIINCTPVGMVGHDGIPLDVGLITGEWAFDAVYTPVETEFVQAARAAGLTVIPGYELFIWQGVHAWQLFTGLPIDVALLRAGLADGEQAD